MPKVKILRSRTGLGLFADEDIKKGRNIVEYTGKKITNKQADEKGGRYLMDLNLKYTLDGSYRWNKARYINHCCEPNCQPWNINGRIWIAAKKDIKRGEQLSYDYGKQYYDYFIKPKGCKCSAKKHRK